MIARADHLAMETEGSLTPAQAVTGEKLFADLATEQLLAMAMKTCDRTGWRDWSRDMLLAFFHNRHGKFVPSAD